MFPDSVLVCPVLTKSVPPAPAVATLPAHVSPAVIDSVPFVAPPPACVPPSVSAPSAAPRFPAALTLRVPAITLVLVCWFAAFDSTIVPLFGLCVFRSNVVAVICVAHGSVPPVGTSQSSGSGPVHAPGSSVTFTAFAR